MRHEDIERYGVKLAERVASQVDTDRRLESMMRAHRRGRVTLALATAAAALAIISWLDGLLEAEQPPVATQPTITAPQESGLSPLPVELYVVLRGGITVGDDGSCAGADSLEDIEEGWELTISEEVGRELRELMSIPLPAGEAVSSGDPQWAFIPFGDQQQACIFRLSDPGFAIRDYDRLVLDPGVLPESGVFTSIAGQRVFVVLDTSDEP